MLIIIEMACCNYQNNFFIFTIQSSLISECLNSKMKSQLIIISPIKFDHLTLVQFNLNPCYLYCLIQSNNFITFRLLTPDQNMQVSIQTERKKKNNFNSANNSFAQIPAETTARQDRTDDSDGADKKHKIKKLTQINRELIQTLKRQNDQLTKKISKQRGKSPSKSFSISQSTQPPKYLESTKKQLSNAYKQIEMYKSILQNLKAKEISTQSLDKINMLENRIKMEDQAIDELQKQLKFLRNIKDQQQKQLQVFQNQEIKRNVQQLENQVKTLKQKLKVARKQAQKRQELQKKQHAYYLQLQKLLRKQNDEYYPGKQTKSNFAPTHQTINSTHQITEKQWQSTKHQLAQLKKQHEQTNKKIELLSRQRNKEIKSFEENQLKLKQRLKKSQQLKNKLAQLTKLVTIKEKVQPQDGGNEQDEDEEGYEAVMKNGKKNYKQKNPNKERQVKRWVIPQGYALEKGKIMPDSIFFSDKTILKNVKKSKIIQIHVWTDSQSTPCLLQFYYSCQKGKKYQGIQSYPNSIAHLEQHVITFKQGDYLYKIEGRLDNGYLMGLTLISKYGVKKMFVNEASTAGDTFKFEPRPNQLPSCLFGAIVKNEDDQIRICHLGCEFIEDW